MGDLSYTHSRFWKAAANKCVEIGAPPSGGTAAHGDRGRISHPGSVFLSRQESLYDDECRDQGASEAWSRGDLHHTLLPGKGESGLQLHGSPAAAI